MYTFICGLSILKHSVISLVDGPYDISTYPLLRKDVELAQPKWASTLKYIYFGILYFTGTKEVEEYVMDTDYESYFITYSCLNQDMHFKCNKPEVSLWSRSTTIPPEKIADAKLTIIGLCLNYDTFVKVEHLNGKSHFMNHIYC